MTDTTYYAIRTFDGLCLTDGHDRDQVINAAELHLGNLMDEDGEYGSGELDVQIVSDSLEAGEQIEPFTLKYHNVRDSYFNDVRAAYYGRAL